MLPTIGKFPQAALCYHGAIVPTLRKYKVGIRAHHQPDSRIQLATEAELLREAEFAILEEPPAPWTMTSQSLRLQGRCRGGTEGFSCSTNLDLYVILTITPQET